MLSFEKPYLEKVIVLKRADPCVENVFNILDEMVGFHGLLKFLHRTVVGITTHY